MSEKRKTSDENSNILSRIDSIGADFRAQWKAGNRSRIEDYLPRVPSEYQSTLLQKLLTIELRYRQRAGEAPTSGEYLTRFPTFRRVIGDVFFESAIMSEGEDGHGSKIDSVDQTVAVEPTTARSFGDYDLIREIGRGAFGIVYEARHKSRGNRVALKSLPSGAASEDVSPDRLHRFRREFRSLSEINHPNLVGMQTLEVDDGKWFFTMDLVEGTDFLTYVRPNDQLIEERLRSSLSQLVKGIIYLHEAGIIHRDLKPSNVLIEPDGRVVILDFGLVAQLQRSNDATISRSGMFAGTPRYAAPEQIFGERSESSDWYAVGTMVYEALTGQTPFDGTRMDVLRQKQETDPPELSHQAEIPSDIALMCDGVLKREPSQRLSTQAILDCLEIDLETRDSGTTHSSRGSSGSADHESLDPESPRVEEIRLVGREEQLAQLEQARDSFVKSGVSSVVWIAGKSGEGKSSLAETFLSPIRKRNELLVFSGRCYDRESVPFKALDGLIESLARYLRSIPFEQVSSLITPDISLLGQLFPALRRVENITRLPTPSGLEPDLVRHRAFQALQQLYKKLAASKPLVLFVDDLQWGDAQSANILFELVSNQSVHAMILGSFRSDEEQKSPFMNRWRSLVENSNVGSKSTTIHVSPLTLEQCMQVTNDALGGTTDSIDDYAQKLFHDSGGNPYLLDQLIEGFDEIAGEFRALSLVEIIEKRLTRLPSHAKKLLAVVAISGQLMSVEEAGAASGCGDSTMPLLTRMRSEKLVRLIDDQSMPFVDTFHDKIRETALSLFTTEYKEATHAKLGEAIEDHSGINAEDIFNDYDSIAGETHVESKSRSQRVFDLSYHFSASKDSRALAYLLAAGEEANRTFALKEAIRHFQNAETLLGDKSSALTRFRVYQGLGLAGMRARQVEIGIRSFEKAVKSAPTSLDRARAHVGLANIHQQSGSFASAVQQSDIAISLIDAKKPRGVVHVLARTPRAVLRIAMISSEFQAYRNEKKKANAVILHEICHSRGFYVFERSTALLIDALIQQVVAAIRVGDPTRLVCAYSDLASMLPLLGLPRISSWALRRAKKYAELHHDRRSEASIIAAEAALHLGKFRWNKVAEMSIDAMNAFMSIGMNSRAHLMAHNIRHVKEWTSSANDEYQWALNELELGNQAQDERAQCWGRYGLAAANARMGKLSDACSEIQQALSYIGIETRNMTGSICRLSYAYVLLQASEYERAYDEANESWQTIVKAGIVNIFTSRCYAHLLEGLAGPNWNHDDKSASKKLFKGKLRWGKIVSRVMSIQRCIVDRARGRAYWRMGHHRKAIKLFESSIHAGREVGLRCDLPRALLDLAAVKEEGRDENRAEAIALLKELDSVVPRAESWLLGDQYDERVVAPEFATDEWEAQHGPLRSS